VSSCRPTAPESILVVRLGAMGDVIHTLAAVAALRAARPNLRIGWIIEARWSELLCAKRAPRSGPRSPLRPLVDFVHEVDTKSWRKSLLAKETRAQIAAIRREVTSQNYEVTSDFQGALKSAVIARLSGAKIVAGFAHPREVPAHFFYNQFVETTDRHVIDQYRRIAEFITGTLLPTCDPIFPRDNEAESRIAARLGPDAENCVLINPGAGWGSKQWPSQRYGAVARALSSDGLTPIVNFGPGEQELSLEVQQASGGVAQPISCSISELIALTRRAKLFIGGDTGPLHLAAAMHVPVVAVFGPTDPGRNGPYSTNSIVLRDPASKTSLSHTSARDPGLLNITAEEVIAAARQLLEKSGG
jgi:heptosyltransferase I